MPNPPAYPLRPCEFIDALGDVWVCRWSTPAWIAACRQLGITAAMMQDPEQMNFGSLAEAVWYSIERLAIPQKITRAEFFSKRLTPPFLMAAIQATLQAFAEAFATADETGVAAEGGGPNPTPPPAAGGTAATEAG